MEDCLLPRMSSKTGDVHQKMVRMRGRPKILLATNYEQAVELYEKYKHNMLGIISDITYPRNGVKDKLAGIRFCKKVKVDKYFIKYYS